MYKTQRIIFSYLKEQEEKLGIRFTDKQFLYEIIFHENDFIRFSYYSDNMSLEDEPIIVNDEKLKGYFQNYFHYIYFLLNQSIEFWTTSSDSEERKLFNLVGNLHYHWSLLGILIVVGKDERSIFEYKTNYVTGSFQSDYYLMLEVLESLEDFCLSRRFREKEDSLYYIESMKFTEDSSDLSQCLSTELGYENVPLPEDSPPF